MKKATKGISLIEIVVVMAILLIIAAITVPVLSKSKHRAHETVCISNMKQIYAAYQLYMADNDDVWPVLQPIDPPMRPYLKVNLECPVRNSLWADKAENVPHYWYVGSYHPQPEPMQSAIDECIALRGPQLPVFLDTNHSSAHARVALGDEWVFVTRKDGSTSRVRPLRLHGPGPRPEIPCSPLLALLNY